MVRRLVVIGAVVAAVIGAADLWRLNARVREYLRGPALGGARIYAAPALVRPGSRTDRTALAQRLVRLGYAEVATEPANPGEFRVQADGIVIRQRPAVSPWTRPARFARVALGKSGVTALRALDGGADPERLELLPEPLATSGRGGTVLEGSERIPRQCRDAVLAAEDRNFFIHPGIDPTAALRAAVANLRAGEKRQGGSTITQQLVKNAFLTPKRTFGRKMREAALALLLEAHTTKEDILGRYLSSVYLGSDDGVPVHGLAQAAAVHLGKTLGELDVADCALLAGMIHSPNRLVPRRHPEAARARRAEVLALMVEAGFLDAAAARAAMAKPVVVGAPRVRPVAALYVADEVARELAQLLPASSRTEGLVVYTSIDADAQREAERAVRRGVEGLQRRQKPDAPRLEAALVALDVATGTIRALVGGRDYRSSPLDRAIRTRRQPGSTFKPFVYLAALDPARSGAGVRTVASPIDDAPLTVTTDGQTWSPVNYRREYLGATTLEDALAVSANTATVRLALDVGIPTVAATARDLGITSPLPEVPALALGAGEVSLLDLTAAYGVIAGGGLRRDPTLILAVTSSDGEVLYAATRAPRQVLDPGVAYLMTHMLERVVDRGTGRGVRAAGFQGAAAGKTGTTDDTRDAWFVGYTPDVAVGVWVGFDEGGSTGLTGAAGALPIWTDFVKATSSAAAPRSFPMPDGIVWREVDPATGRLATAWCPERRRVPLLATSPLPGECDRHGTTRVARGDVREQPSGDERVDAADVPGPLERFGRRVRGWFEGVFR